MNKRKIMSFLIASAIITNLNVVAFADGSINKREVKPALLISTQKQKKDYRINEDMAKEIAKKIISNYFEIEINSDFKYYSNLNEYKNSDKEYAYWNVTFELNTHEKNIYVNVRIDANSGLIKEIRIYDNSSDNRASIPNISFNEAQQVGIDFLNKINPKLFKQCELKNKEWVVNKYDSTNYTFNYVRKVNGLRYYDNNISVTVNGVTGKVTSYSCNWDNNIIFPEVKYIISKNDVEKIFDKQLKVNLVYKTFRNKYEYQDADNKRNVKLVYKQNLENGNLIDAITGDVLYTNKGNYRIEEKNLNDEQKEEFYKSYKAVHKFKEPISKDKAYEFISKYIVDNYGKGFDISNLSYSNDEAKNKKQWRASFSKKSVKQEGVLMGAKDAVLTQETGYITIDALTGQIISMSKNNYYKPYNLNDEDFEPVLTWEEGYNKAIYLLKKYYPDKIKNINLLQKHYIHNDESNVKEKTKYKEKYYNYSFSRVENGIPYNDNSINVSINTKTGEISNINFIWYYDVEFKSPKNAINENMIRKMIFDKYEPELYYAYTNSDKVDTVKENNGQNIKQNDKHMKLVYSLRGRSAVYSFNDIDAFTGKLLDYSGEEINDNVEQFMEEIKGSKYEKEMQILAYCGIIDTKGFKLKREVQYRDLIKTLVDALGYRPYVIEQKSVDMNLRSVNAEEKTDEVESNYLSPQEYIKMAKYYGLLDKDISSDDLKKIVTRQEMSKAFIKFLDYDKVAKCNEIFALKFDDANKINEENIGYVAIAYGLGLFKIENNRFRPNDKSTYEEMCIALFNALQNKEKNNGYIWYK